jgi:hypothetical protein
MIPIGDAHWQKKIKDYDKVKTGTASVGLEGDLTDGGSFGGYWTQSAEDGGHPKGSPPIILCSEL